MRAVTASICKRGGRTVNQDAVCAETSADKLCLVACDGLGAYEGSELVSRLCADTLAELFRDAGEITEQDVRAFFREAHDRIVMFKSGDPRLASSCTTAACVFCDGRRTFIAHTGDTRVYYFRAGREVFRTTDHSAAQLAVDHGKIDADGIRAHRDRNKLTRVVGGKYFVLPDVHVTEGAPAEGDAFLLCTDGFWEYVPDDEMKEAALLCASPEDALARLENVLLDHADADNDNYSAIMTFVV